MIIPFEVGQELWMPVGKPEQVAVECPICAGKLGVVVILGSGERVGVACKACRLKGVIHEWEHQAQAVPFIIDSAVSFNNDKWRLRSTTGAEYDLIDLYLTEAEALSVAAKRAAAWHGVNMKSRQYHRKNLHQHTWSIQYHRNQIADLERQLVWHRAQVCAHATLPTSNKQK